MDLNFSQDYKNSKNRNCNNFCKLENLPKKKHELIFSKLQKFKKHGFIFFFKLIKLKQHGFDMCPLRPAAGYMPMMNMPAGEEGYMRCLLDAACVGGPPSRRWGYCEFGYKGVICSTCEKDPLLTESEYGFGLKGSFQVIFTHRLRCSIKHPC